MASERKPKCLHKKKRVLSDRVPRTLCYFSRPIFAQPTHFSAPLPACPRIVSSTIYTVTGGKHGASFFWCFRVAAGFVAVGNSIELPTTIAFSPLQSIVVSTILRLLLLLLGHGCLPFCRLRIAGNCHEWGASALCLL